MVDGFKFSEVGFSGCSIYEAGHNQVLILDIGIVWLGLVITTPICVGYDSQELDI